MSLPRFQKEATNKHADDIQQRVNAENQRNEQERVGVALQVGVVPAHVLAPLIRKIMVEDTGGDLRAYTRLIRSNHANEEYQTTTRRKDRELYGGLDDFTEDEERSLRYWRTGASVTDWDSLFAVNTKIRARNSGYMRAQVLKREKAEAKAKAVPRGPPKAPPKAPPKTSAP